MRLLLLITMRSTQDKLNSRDPTCLFNSAQVSENDESLGSVHFGSVLGCDPVRDFVVCSLRHDAPRHHFTGFGVGTPRNHAIGF